MHVSAPRNASTPLSFSARSSLDPSSYAPIDSILKNLKTCSRRLQTALSAHRDEMQILERLHYKGKNQHRSALFWRRVTEIRRYGMRLHGVGLYGILETLRASFFGVSSAQNQKALKGSWTHVPNSRYVEFAIERLHACTSLVSKTRERLLEAYNMFNLSMQTGAFVQLLLTLIAICSRTSMLLTEIEESMELSREVCCSLLLVLDPANTNKPGSAATKPISIEDNESHSNTTWAAEPNDLDTVYEDEDVGKAVSRARGRSSSPHPQTLLPPTLPENTTRSDDDEMIIGDTDARMTLPTIVKQIPLAMASHASVAPASGNFGKKRGTTGEEKAKKKKKKKNEIDDIFGF